jgi:hypothetical protein
VTGAEERPKPRYGEYATPEEVAAARGPIPVEPSDPVSRLAAPIRPVPPRAAHVVARPPRPAHNTITVLLLIVGIWYTVSTIPSYLDFGPFLSQAWALAGYGTASFGGAAHTAGIVLLVASLLVLIAAVGVSFALMRAGRRSIWVPVVAAVAYLVASFIVMAVVVANTPAVADMLHNR